MRRYALTIELTDKRPGWQIGTRIAPRGLTIRVQKYGWFEIGREPVELSERELVGLAAGSLVQGPDRVVGYIRWLELDVESGPSQPPRCVALRAPRGIGTPELRFPLAGVVVEATAAVASRDGSFTDPPQGIEYDDAVFEANRVRGRKRTRQTITPERLEEVIRIASEHPRTPTAAVQRHFGISRGYARKLVKRAEALGAEPSPESKVST